MGKLWFVLCVLPLVLSASLKYAIKGRTRPCWDLRFTLVMVVIGYSMAMTDRGNVPIASLLPQDMYETAKKVRANMSKLTVKSLKQLTAAVKSYGQKRGIAQVVEVSVQDQVIIERLDAKILEVAGEALRSYVPPADFIFGVDIPAPEALSAEWVQSVASPKSDKAIFYIHGGAYILMSARETRGIVTNICHELQCRAFSINYRLAPEYPFPAALLDAVSAYIHLLKTGQSADKIVFMGDSAGGGLAMCLLVFLRDFRGRLETALGMIIPMPGSAVLFSPWVDLTLRLPSVKLNTRFDALSDPHEETGTKVSPGYLYASGLYTSTAYKNEQALKDLDDFLVTHPYISPARAADLSFGLPPILVQAGGIECLLSDQLALYYSSCSRQTCPLAELYPWVSRWTDIIVPDHPVFPVDDFKRESKKIFRLATSSSTTSGDKMTMQIFRDMVHVLPVFTFAPEFIYSMEYMSKWIGVTMDNLKHDDASVGGLFYVDTLEILKHE